MITEFYFMGVSRVRMSYQEGEEKSQHVATDFFLEVSDNLSKEQYLDEEGLPTEAGVKPLTIAFINGIIGNIHMAHQKGWWDSAEHLRHAIALLTAGFAEVNKIRKGDF